MFFDSSGQTLRRHRNHTVRAEKGRRVILWTGEELVPTEELLSSPFSTTTQTVIKFTVVITSSSAPPVALTTLSVRASKRSRVVSGRDSPFLAILLFCALSPVYAQDCNGPPQQSSSCSGRTSTAPPPVSEVPLEAPPQPRLRQERAPRSTMVMHRTQATSKHLSKLRAEFLLTKMATAGTAR